MEKKKSSGVQKSVFPGSTKPQTPGGTIFDMFREIEEKKMVKDIERGDYSKGCKAIRDSITGGRSVEELIDMYLH